MRTRICRVVELPELVRLICSFAETVHLVKLLTVSHHFFYCAAPLIWREVSGITKLLDLLPDLGSDQLNQGIHPSDRIQLNRFNIYAPFVRNLKSGMDDEAVANWLILLAKVPNRPLLPLLQVLNIRPRVSEQHGPQIVEYAEALLCSTLSNIRIAWDCYGLRIDPVDATHLLGQMVRICPNLTNLYLNVEESDYFNHLRSLGTYTKPGPLSFVSQFLNLRVLSTSSMALNHNVLQLLGHLPCLEQLRVHSVMDDDISITNMVIPSNSFPSLRHIELDCVSALVMSKLWQTIPLVQKLVSVVVELMGGSDEAIDKLICDICQGSPFITDLELGFGGLERDFTLSTTALDHFGQLPLKRVNISFGYADCRHLVSVLPNVEYLSMSALIVYHSDLVLMSKIMPRLQYLFAHLALEEWPSSLPRNPASLSPIHIDAHFGFQAETGLRGRNLAKYVDDVARNLHSLWPKGMERGPPGGHRLLWLFHRSNQAVEEHTNAGQLETSPQATAMGMEVANARRRKKAWLGPYLYWDT
ncbi:hypothetical protein BDV93DRAFT_554462 [Ceratobasidium sp. AG-I]|nr:hypothetical protein BDV93DRAFT_554462 [Ceratobasidium sp. AG-I]